MQQRFSSITRAFQRNVEKSSYDGPIPQELVQDMLNVATDAIQEQLGNDDINGILRGVLIGYELVPEEGTAPNEQYDLSWGDVSIYEYAKSQSPVEADEKEKLDPNDELLSLDFMIGLSSGINEELRKSLEQARPDGSGIIFTHVFGQVELNPNDRHWNPIQSVRAIGLASCCQKRDGTYVYAYIDKNGRRHCLWMSPK